jgi:hypothetical protein
MQELLVDFITSRLARQRWEAREIVLCPHSTAVSRGSRQ